MQFARFWRHLVLPHWYVQRAFPVDLAARIEQAIAASETRHRGELRLVAETNLAVTDLLAGQTTRERALELFSQLRVWDTEENSGVLIYLQLIDRRVEIVADRGIAGRVAPSFWDGVCRQMERAFRAGDFAAGTLQALDAMSEMLAVHFPAAADNANELPDRPLLL